MAAEARIQALVDPALTRLGLLIDNADGDSVKLSAVKDVLDRAGYKAVDKTELDIKTVKVIDAWAKESLK